MNLRFALAQHIRVIDGDNTMPARRLGMNIAGWLADHSWRVDEDDVVTVVEEHNADKRMGAAALADTLVDELDLDT